MERIADEQSDSTIESMFVEIDWEGYYTDFCRAHGDYPVFYKGLLLFRDGWMYSMTDYAGPEYPPPQDELELTKLQLFYYKRRLQIVSDDLWRMEGVVQSIKQLQRHKNQPLKQVVVIKDEETGTERYESKAIDLLFYEKRCQWLENDIVECRTHITKLEQTIRKLS